MWMTDWLWRRLGYHVCDEFTQWEARQANFVRVPVDAMEFAITGKTEIEYTRRWQERRCTVCGVIQQRDLKV